jgi:phage terminase large subunit-like protein
MRAARARTGDQVEFVKFHANQAALAKALTGRDLLRCGRRYGKTTTIENIAGFRALKGKRVGIFMPAYKLLTPTYARINRILAPARERSSKQDMIIETQTGGCVEFWTLDNPDAGRSRFYDLVILDEASLVVRGLKDTWEQAIAPTLLDRDGDAIIAGTPKGIDPDNFFHELYADAANNPNLIGRSRYGFTDHHRPTWENPMLNPEAVARLKDDNPPLVYQQEFCAEFVDWSGAAFFSLPSLLAVDHMGGEPQPVEYPVKCDAVFATIDSAIKTGKENDGTAVIYWAQQRVGVPLTVLDYDIVQIEGASLETWLPSVFEKLEGFARETQARHGSLGAHIEDKASGMILLQQARNRGWPAHEIDSGLTAVGKEERAISVSGYVYRGMVKLSRQAHDKVMVYKNQSRNHLISQVCGFRIGVKDPRAQDDLLDTFTYGVAIALGDQDGF